MNKKNDLDLVLLDIKNRIEDDILDLDNLIDEDGGVVKILHPRHSQLYKESSDYKENSDYAFFGSKALNQNELELGLEMSKKNNLKDLFEKINKDEPELEEESSKKKNLKDILEKINNKMNQNASSAKKNEDIWLLRNKNFKQNKDIHDLEGVLNQKKNMDFTIETLDEETNNGNICNEVFNKKNILNNDETDKLNYLENQENLNKKNILFDGEINNNVSEVFENQVNLNIHKKTKSLRNMIEGLNESCLQFPVQDQKSKSNKKSKISIFISDDELFENLFLNFTLLFLKPILNFNLNFLEKKSAVNIELYNYIFSYLSNFLQQIIDCACDEFLDNLFDNFSPEVKTSNAWEIIKNSSEYKNFLSDYSDKFENLTGFDLKFIRKHLSNLTNFFEQNLFFLLHANYTLRSVKNLNDNEMLLKKKELKFFLREKINQDFFNMILERIEF